MKLAPPLNTASRFGTRRQWAGRLSLLGMACCAAASAQAGPLTLDDVVTGDTLRFLSVRPDPDAYWYESTAHISPESLQNGVVALDTCHHRLDAVHRVVVVFNADRIQSLAVQSSDGVQNAEVVGKRVELTGVQHGASVCVRVNSRALDAGGPGQWQLQAGPLMRRYLDGYLPMRARLRVRWPTGLLQLQGTDPPPQPGVVLEQEAASASLDVTFAGRLRPQFRLGAPQAEKTATSVQSR